MTASTPRTPARAPQPTTTAPGAPAPAAAVAATSSSATAAHSTPTPQAAPATFNDPSALAMGSARESAINNMLEMGFERPQIEAAMRAAFNNPDRAVEYLMSVGTPTP